MSDLVLLMNTVASAVTSADAAAAAPSYLPLGKGIAFGVAAAGAGIGIGLVVAAALSGIARQPEQKGPISTLMYIGVGFIEVLALIGLALTFIMN